ncbi:STAS domain-containing protein [Streptomyces flavofungini]|uniref:STAS domain-containing protein n=1 Tax=Streptomyces flavofungini TaxID=68200 RepID=UPI0034DED94C
MSIDEQTVDDIRVVLLGGEIDHDTAGAVRESILRTAGAGAQRVVADLSSVTFLDSSGINVFLAAGQLISDGGGWLRIAGAQTPVRRVIEMIGLNLVIDCHPSVDQALAG